MASKYERVAVIGAGISGVLSALHLKEAGTPNIVVFERSGVAGGVWVYDPRRPLEPSYPSVKPIDNTESEDGSETLDVIEEIFEVDEDEKEKILLQHASPSPCYEGLTNNVSTPLMAIKNQQWPPGTADFVTHDVLGKYVQQVPIRGSFQDLIRFNTRVSKLWKKKNVWFLESIELKELNDGRLKKTRRVDEFDAVFIASGHYDLPNVPDIPGLKEWRDRFPTRIQHSKGYRKANDFTGENVLLIGGGVSAADIAKELGPVARSIIQSSRGGKRDLRVSWLPVNGNRVGSIRSLNLDADSSTKTSGAIPGTVAFEDGMVLENIDRVIICTGYHMSYPFLRNLHKYQRPEQADEDEFVLVTNGSQTHKLYKDLIYIPDPTLAFVGIPYYTATFSLFEFQAIVAAKVFSGKAALPPQAREEYLQRLKSKGYGRDLHDLMGQDVVYVNELLDWINRDGEKFGEAPVDGHTENWHLAFDKMKKLREETLRFKN